MPFRSGLNRKNNNLFRDKNVFLRIKNSLTEWFQKSLSQKVLNKLQIQLLALGIIDKKSTFTKIVKTV